MAKPRNKSFVVLISGSGSNLQAIIDAVARHQINASISGVISNRADAFGLERARQAGITDIVIDHTQYSTRQDFDQALSETINKLGPDLIVLAGFMRILSNEFIDQFKEKLLNIHPSLLPRYKGLHTHRRVLEAGDSMHGASVHFVNNELDSGPVVIQAEVAVKDNDTESTLTQRVHQLEHIIYPMAIQWFIDGRLKMNNNQLFLDNKLITHPARWISNTLQLPEETA